MNTTETLPVVVLVFGGTIIATIVCGLLEKGSYKLAKWIKNAYLRARHRS